MQKKLEGGGGKPTIVAVVVEPWRHDQAWRPEEATRLSIFVFRFRFSVNR